MKQLSLATARFLVKGDAFKNLCLPPRSHAQCVVPTNAKKKTWKRVPLFDLCRLNCPPTAVSDKTDPAVFRGRGSSGNAAVRWMCFNDCCHLYRSIKQTRTNVLCKPWIHMMCFSRPAELDPSKQSPGSSLA